MKNKHKEVEVRSRLSSKDRKACKSYSKNKQEIISSLRLSDTAKHKNLNSLLYKTEEYSNVRDLDLSQEKYLKKPFDIR